MTQDEWASLMAEREAALQTEADFTAADVIGTTAGWSVFERTVDKDRITLRELATVQAVGAAQAIISVAEDKALALGDKDKRLVAFPVDAVKGFRIHLRHIASLRD